MPERNAGNPVAIAHDYLTQRGGAERVVLAMSRAFPDASIYTLLYDPEGTFPEFRERRIVTSPLNRVAPVRKHHRAALPLLPLAAQNLRVPADVVISSSSGWAHGFRTEGRMLVYCHNPARWLYQVDEYLGDGVGARAKRLALMPLHAPLVRWDRRAASQADHYLANSSVVRERVRAAYGIEAELLFPPAGVSAEGEREVPPALADWAGGGFHLVVSRLLPYKNVDVVLRAFSGLDERLVVVGRGPEEDRLRAMAPPNARLVTGLSDAELRWAYANARSLIAPSLEDFGLTPLEAAAFGVPVLALRSRGYLDTVVEGVTGLFFDDPDPDQIRSAVTDAAKQPWPRKPIEDHLDAFSEAAFRTRLRELATGPNG